MLAVCVASFRDAETGLLRSVGDTFEVTQERLGEINGTKYGTLAEAVPEKRPVRRGRKARTEE